jgi:hypothetical protein
MVEKMKVVIFRGLKSCSLKIEIKVSEKPTTCILLYPKAVDITFFENTRVLLGLPSHVMQERKFKIQTYIWNYFYQKYSAATRKKNSLHSV